MQYDREIMQQALDALTRIWEDGLENYPVWAHEAAIDNLRERLAQPEQAPMSLNDGRLTQYLDGRIGVGTPQRKPLTDEVIWLEYQRFWPFHPAEEPTLAKDIVKFARAIEAKLKEKNNG